MKESFYRRLLPNSDHCMTHLVWRDTPFTTSGVVACKLKFERTKDAIRLHMVADFPEYFQKLALLRTQFVEVRDSIDMGLPYRWKGELSTSNSSSAWGVFYVRNVGRGQHVAITLADCSRSMEWIDAPASRARRLIVRTIEILDEHIENLNNLYSEVGEFIEDLRYEPVC